MWQFLLFRILPVIFLLAGGYVFYRARRAQRQIRAMKTSPAEIIYRREQKSDGGA